MKEHPIIFNGEMVRAILDGKKTQTRRVIKPQQQRCPYGVPGDRLWVREAFAVYQTTFGNPKPLVFYRATASYQGDRWKPSIHMSRWASRINLIVKNIRIEKLQDISHKDSLAEGVNPNAPLNNYGTGSRYRDTFAKLWDSIYEKRGYGWNINPWVWVIEFDLEVKK